MKKILITGGAGFIGYHLANYLSANKKNLIYIVDNLSRGKIDKEFKQLLLRKNVKFFNVDLSEEVKIKIKNIDITYHLAAKVGVANINKSPLNAMKINMLSLINVINFLKKSKNKSKIVFFSTSEVYSPLIFGRRTKQLFCEKKNLILNEKVKSRDSYFLSKIFGEKYVKLSGLNYIILRPHNIYGPRMGYSHVIPELIKKIIFLKKFNIFSPYHTRAFCYIDDAISQILFVVKKKVNETYNIGNPNEEINMINLASLIKVILNSKSKLIRGIITPGSPPRRIPNIKKIKDLGYKNKFLNLKNGLIKTVSWYAKKNN